MPGSVGVSRDDRAVAQNRDGRIERTDGSNRHKPREDAPPGAPRSEPGPREDSLSGSGLTIPPPRRNGLTRLVSRDAIFWADLVPRRDARRSWRLLAPPPPDC